MVHNWSWQPALVETPADLTDVLNGDLLPAGTDLELGAWDVRVFLTATDPDDGNSVDHEGVASDSGADIDY